VILSRTAEGANKGLDAAHAQGELLKGEGILPATRVDEAFDRLAGSADFDAAIRAADIVIESAPEDMAFKQALFARLDAIARPDAVLATNTSGLSITAVASRCTRRERVVTAHFWNPPHLMPLVEVVMGEKTSPAVAAELRDLLSAGGKMPVIVKKDRPGQ